MNKLEGKTVLITGAASGIGKMLAQMFQGVASSLILWDRDQINLEQLVEDLGGRDKNVFGFTVDLSELEEIEIVGNRVLNEIGTVDILINNAGIVVGKLFNQHTSADIEETMRINSNALMHTARLFLPGMMAQNSGNICNIASSAGLTAVPGMTVYVGSKFAVVGWSDALRLEMKKLKKSIHITTVTPYFIDTGMFEGVKSQVPFLNGAKVAKKIYKGIERNRKMVSMPFSYHFIRTCQGLLPGFLYEWVMGSVLGIYNSMDYFKGRKIQDHVKKQL